MHAALEIPEIVQAVFGQIDHSPQSIGGYDLDIRTLAVLARTCSAFCDPALDLLWAEQRDLGALMGCFPNGLFVEVETPLLRLTENDNSGEGAVLKAVPGRTVKDLHMRRPITGGDWERPLVYSHRVKTLHLDNTSVAGIKSASTSAFYDVCLALPGSHLFPNLRDLRISLFFSFPEMQCDRVVPFLLAPNIERIKIFLKKSDRASHILPTLAERCPSIAYLDISCWDDADAERHAASVLIQQLRHLQELCVKNLNQAAFEYLRRLPTLTALLVERHTTNLLVDDDETDSFSSLKSLEFGETTLDRLMEFMKVIRKCPLERFEARNVEESTATTEMVVRLFSTLAGQCPHTSLRTIEYYARIFSNPPSEPTDYVLTGQTLRPLFCFMSMVHVTLYRLSGIDLTDDDVFELASAWPRLELLSLGGFNHVPSRVTLHALSVFARCCPRLASLSLALNASLVPDNSADIPPQHLMEYIYLGRAVITAPARVAQYVAAMFPATKVNAWANLEADAPRNVQERVYHDRWQIVQEHLVAIRSLNNN
ncbi:hypothetical protein C8F04DRAFT_1390734 [Mycena alexandri]|uniref:F-box domain-containing protein n=1 Tax=Mycena alexandri TaxID=1745969 RepID=A0AAD6T9N3_9AGAR|nr:hypothetical protein C8F04DRAFT_1390734 [Mycena alexandri]